MWTSSCISIPQLLHVWSRVIAIDGVCHNCEAAWTFNIVLGTEWAASRWENTCYVFALLAPSKERSEEGGISGEEHGKKLWQRVVWEQRWEGSLAPTLLFCSLTAGKPRTLLLRMTWASQPGHKRSSGWSPLPFCHPNVTTSSPAFRSHLTSPIPVKSQVHVR